MTTLYHATPLANLPGIVEEGLQPGPDGLVYTSNEPHYAAGFLLLRAGWLKQTFGDVRVVSIPIDRDVLPAENWEPGTDHAPGFVPDDLEVWAYDGEIPPAALDFDSLLVFGEEDPS